MAKRPLGSHSTAGLLMLRDLLSDLGDDTEHLSNVHAVTAWCEQANNTQKKSREIC